MNLKFWKKHTAFAGGGLFRMPPQAPPPSPNKLLLLSYPCAPFVSRQTALSLTCFLPDQLSGKCIFRHARRSPKRLAPRWRARHRTAGRTIRRPVRCQRAGRLPKSMSRTWVAPRRSRPSRRCRGSPSIGSSWQAIGRSDCKVPACSSPRDYAPAVAGRSV